MTLNPKSRGNVILGLNLQNYVKDMNSLRKFQTTINQVRGEVVNGGTIPSSVQTKLSSGFSDIFYKIINEYIKPRVSTKKKSSIESFVSSGNVFIFR